MADTQGPSEGLVCMKCRGTSVNGGLTWSRAGICHLGDDPSTEPYVSRAELLAEIRALRLRETILPVLEAFTRESAAADGLADVLVQIPLEHLAAQLEQQAQDFIAGQFSQDGDEAP